MGNRLDNARNINKLLSEWGGGLSLTDEKIDYGEPYDKCFSDDETRMVTNKIALVSELVDLCGFPNIDTKLRFYREEHDTMEYKKQQLDEIVNSFCNGDKK